MKLIVLKLGTECRDKATGLQGTVTHWICNMEESVGYMFQPKMLDEEGQPVRKLYVTLERLEVEKDALEEIDVPLEILGSIVEDKASGFKGMGVELIMHISGCFHVTIQPEGVLPNKKTPISAHDFDLRRCVGDKIPKMTEEEIKQSEQTKPSPTGDRFDGSTRSGSHLAGDSIR